MERLPPPTEAEWRDWRWQLRNRITTADQLANYINLTAAEREESERAASSSGR